MTDWKLGLLNLYYHGSYPYRWWQNRRVAAAGKTPVMVLFYHRVAEETANPWTCSPGVFARQMRWLKANFDLVSLSEAQRRIRSGANHRPSVSITFDDGYADNCRCALPLLIREKIPCTYFVATRYVFQRVAFPHDLEAGTELAPNTLAQLKQLAAAGVEIGAHTRTHADLGCIDDPEQLYDEVVTAGQQLQAAIGRPVRYFAFPYGQYANLNVRAFQLAREAGYEGVCSAYGGFNFPGDDAFHLQRIPGDADMIRLKNWTTMDPRKLGARRFEYLEAPSSRHLTGADS